MKKTSKIPFGMYCYNPESKEEETTCQYYEDNKDGTNTCTLEDYTSTKDDPDVDGNDLFNEKCKVCNYNREL